MPRGVRGDIARCPVLSCGEIVARDEGVKASWRIYVGADGGERRFALSVDEIIRSPVSCDMMVIAESKERAGSTGSARRTRLEEVTTGEIASPGDGPSPRNEEE